MVSTRPQLSEKERAARDVFARLGAEADRFEGYAHPHASRVAAIADALADRSGRNSARQIGNIMSRHGSAVPWHRVVTSAGRLPPGNEQEARARLLSEGAPLNGEHVDMKKAAWAPS